MRGSEEGACGLERGIVRLKRLGGLEPRIALVPSKVLDNRRAYLDANSSSSSGLVGPRYSKPEQSISMSNSNVLNLLHQMIHERLKRNVVGEDGLRRLLAVAIGIRGMCRGWIELGE